MTMRVAPLTASSGPRRESTAPPALRTVALECLLEIPEDSAEPVRFLARAFEAFAKLRVARAIQSLVNPGNGPIAGAAAPFRRRKQRHPRFASRDGRIADPIRTA